MAYNNGYRNNGNKNNGHNNENGFNHVFSKSRKFVNPYNFVPVDLKKKTVAKETTGKLYTGVLECRLITRTPLAIPDVETKRPISDKSEHMVYDFFRYGDKLVIPGSTLRGVIRSVYETITDSCFSTTGEEEIITMRYSDTAQPGVLINEKGIWKLYEKKNNGKSDIGRELVVKNMDRAMSGLDAVYRDYNNPAINKKLTSKGFYSKYNEQKSKGKIPVKYLYDNKTQTVKLSFATMGRFALDKNMGELVEEKRPCKDRSQACCACRLFGMTSRVENIGSRIRITDAICITKNPETEHKTLGELSSPKSTYFPFYYDASDSIRGRKFYWHTPSKRELKDIWSNDRDKENKRAATMELLQSNVEFEFKVYYNDVTQEELEQIIWTLTLSDNEEKSKYCYKIGHGKPLGLGSAKLVIDKKLERSVINGEYVVDIDEAICATDVLGIDKESQAVQSLLKISDMTSTKGLQVRYPYVEKPRDFKARPNYTAAHQWFSRNKNDGKVNVKNHNVRRLPEITSDNITLPAMEIIERN